MSVDKSVKRHAAYSLVVRVDEDDLVVLVHTVLVNPVRVEHTQVAAAAADALLRNALETALGLELVHTLVGGLAVGSALGSGSLAATAADTDAVDHVALLSLVALYMPLVSSFNCVAGLSLRGGEPCRGARDGRRGE